MKERRLNMVPELRTENLLVQAATDSPVNVIDYR